MQVRPQSFQVDLCVLCQQRLLRQLPICSRAQQHFRVKAAVLSMEPRPWSLIALVDCCTVRMVAASTSGITMEASDGE